MIERLLPSLVDGLLIGVIYGLAAMGLTLIFGVMNVINLSHGSMIAMGMFGVYALFIGPGLNPFAGVAAVAALGLVAGVLVYAVAVHRIRNAPHLSSLLATFSVNLILMGLGTRFLSTNFRNVDYSLGSVSLGPVTVTGTRIAACGCAALVTGLLYWFLYRTRSGKEIRAVANDRAAAELVGIRSTRVLALSFGLGTSLAAVAGGLIATLFPFTVLSGGTYELKSFVIVVLGGLGNPLGALIGGVLLGLVEGAVPLFLDASWVPVIEFALFVLVLLVRPQGLLGARR
ncbi:MAG: branched-chain amino acid ABC transporter permease [Planctomycetota bacterium]